METNKRVLPTIMCIIDNVNLTLVEDFIPFILSTPSRLTRINSRMTSNTSNSLATVIVATSLPRMQFKINVKMLFDDWSAEYFDNDLT
jgi:hypothetical protein